MLCVVLVHTNCGAVGAALEEDPGSYIQTLVDEIKKAIGDEKDPKEASRKNARYGADRIAKELHIPDEDGMSFKVVPAIYDIGDGSVTFI